MKLLALPLLASAAVGAPFSLFFGSGEKDLARYREYGYNAAVLGNFTELATYAEAAPKALPAGSPLRARIEENRNRLRKQLAEARRLGLAACLSTDEILLPTAVLESLGPRITLEGDPARVDLEKEAFWELYRAKYREVLRAFPEIAYVMVRTGENYSYLHDGYSGQLIAERTSSATRSDAYFRNMQRLINETRKIVVDEFGRALIWRTWDLGNYGFHASPEVYDRVLAGVPNRKGLIFSIKFTQTDFWRYNDFNPNIGRGGVDQIVEFQSAREYEGKGAFPDYVGPEHAEALRRAAAAPGVKGVWNWNFGGGWGGPFLKSDRWVRANIHATARLARDPSLNPRALAEEWAAAEFGKQAAPKVAAMLMESPECVLGFRYIAPYARRNKGWLPSLNIMRDDIIRGGKQILPPLYEGSRDSLAEALAEKAQAVERAGRMLATFQSARAEIVAARGERVYNEARNSILYMQALARVMSHYVRGMFLFYRWQETREADMGRTARDELLALRKAWETYQRDIGKLEDVASLYRSLNSQKETDHESAMEATAEQALAALPGAASAALPFQDLALEERADRLVFSNARVRLELGKTRGEWLSFEAQGIPGSLTTPAESPAAVDFRIDDVWMVERHGAAYLRHTVAVDAPRRSATVCLVLGVGPPSRPPLIPDRWRERTSAGKARPAPEFELASCYALFAGQSRVERTARVTRMGGADILASTYVRMQGFLFELPGALIADAEECTVENPGPLYLNTYLPPDTPYTKVRDRFVSLSSAPDSTPGVVAIVNRKRSATLASWLDTGGEANYISYLSGDGRRITVLHCDLRVDRMHRRGVVTSDTQRIEFVQGGLPETLARYREMLRRTMPLAANTPAWAREMTLLEVLPSYFPDGIRGLTKKLPFYKEIGFNTIYLMPHWVGGYSPVDLYQVEPSIGTAEDLKEMVRAAHALGLKVLFDMVIHGFNTRSPIVGQRPELFQKDEHGLIVPHQTWGSMSTDAASPAYRQYMIDLALHDLRTYDIDGYRVDANAYKMPNWDPRAATAPGVSGPATRSLMISMYEEMRKVKPDSVLLSEIFGPVWHSVCNLVHDNMTQGSIAFLEMMDRGEVDAESYKRHMARLVEALPEGALRVRFGRNHDTSWFYHFPGYTPRFMALDAIHAFFGILEVFAGDRKNPPHPDDDPAVYDYYRKLFAARRQFPELVSGDVLLREVESSNRMVFTGLRRQGGRLTLVAISLDGKEVEADIVLPRECRPEVELHDPIAGSAATAAASGRTLRLKLKPYQVLIARL